MAQNVTLNTEAPADKRQYDVIRESEARSREARQGRAGAKARSTNGSC